MDWRKTKTIFIITFLVLNIFLGYQIYEKSVEAPLDLIAEPKIEEQFEADEITYDKLPKEPIKESYISGKSYKFTVENLEDLENKNQDVEIVDETILVGAFEEPIVIPENNTSSRFAQFLKDQILFGDKYEFWGYSEEANEVIFLQKHKNSLIYNSSNSGMLNLILDDKNNIVSYRQTFITDLEDMDEAQELINAFEALENMYNMNELKPGSHVTKVEFGYYTLVQYTNSHVLTPTWHIVVNGEQDYFVNAFEGQVITRKDNRAME
ncbi:two-component system regulatory protein YycI [Sutcliffiella halmapala]|uniref:two-component system regulatory protein YycI n=1 Tax=Sutcliffiella halmapala TaxID=79882 RepID=UPI0009954386|nr:two-component system regulatory protein YycI [Sutcliffiella halmapala]